MCALLAHVGRACAGGRDSPRGERAVHAVLGGLRVRRVPVAAPALRNVNVPGDLPSP